MNSHILAGKHTLHYDRPAATFFEGALLGNGGLGVVVTTRPDAVAIHFGHNNVWDIRIEENHQDQIGDFESLFTRMKDIPVDFASLDEDDWYREYVQMTAENYSHPYPRPMPCGTLVLGFDRREAEVLGHSLHMDNGLCEVHFKFGDGEATLQIFADQNDDRLWLTIKNADGTGPASLFNRVRLLPDPNTPQELPELSAAVDFSASQLSYRQILPFSVKEDAGEAERAKNRAFRLSARLSQAFEQKGTEELEAGLIRGNTSFTACIMLEEGLDTEVSKTPPLLPEPDYKAFTEAMAASDSVWDAFWSRSGVSLEDEELEQVWYRNLYFFQCAVKPGVTCPGLFANWSYGRIGSEWHGDYHMNYNTQQPFWLAFSSNHADKHLPYVDMVDHVLPVSRKWANEYYGLRGAYFPHSAYPVEMNMMPYPVPHWGWEICETPWTVQSLWWHYMYTMDEDFLAERAFCPIKDAVLFMVDYMKRPDAHGEAWGDDRYHIYPTVVPELYELTPGFKKNKDCLVDLTLTKFLFHAFGKACAVLKRTEAEQELLQEVRDILERFPEYPTAISQRGEVFVSVHGEDPEAVYNVPNSITPVFPGEEYGLHSSPEDYEIALNSYLNHRNEGGNELVFYHMAGARLGRLDLERFKRQIAYCMLPNGTCTDKLLEAGGRYSDATAFDYMAPMGIWFENFALPAVINECLMQSYNGIIRLFPNWPLHQRAEFSTLRAVGGFLISASAGEGTVSWVEVQSEAGEPLSVYNPWGDVVTCIREQGSLSLSGSILTIDTVQGETLRLEPASASSH
ncbi:glycosyl hydrolase family 95 catalytic domain-containing protein [Paenibacillus pinihumi]|uniref:glycosyl hydrolase family 95 catalytic domain-containing protein n=1 Tax=Paenibacillus pinihumi TaxID=669462 RepID=UPI00041C4B3D|nr:glycoside hydrolase N-terminal domain-containing protein [Paenibacillus pinihumi]